MQPVANFLNKFVHWRYYKMLEPIQITIIMLFFLYKKLLYMMYNTLNTLNLNHMLIHSLKATLNSSVEKMKRNKEDLDVLRQK